MKSLQPAANAVGFWCLWPAQGKFGSKRLGENAIRHFIKLGVTGSESELVQ